MCARTRACKGPSVQSLGAPPCASRLHREDKKHDNRQVECCNPSPQEAEAEAEGSEFEKSLNFITNSGHSELHCQASFQKLARARSSGIVFGQHALGSGLDP